MITRLVKTATTYWMLR